MLIEIGSAFIFYFILLFNNLDNSPKRSIISLTNNKKVNLKVNLSNPLYSIPERGKNTLNSSVKRGVLTLQRSPYGCYLPSL